jgi:ribosome-binding protein aMBF1 (putative translation factor)
MEKNPLKAWRDDKQLSQAALADLIGVKAMTVSRWERGVLLPRKKLWPKIEETTGIVPTQLVEHVKQGAAQ